MGWSKSDEESRADHFIDERKHDWRPGDKPAHRLDIPIPTAFDVAALVRLVDVNIGAQLIEQYAKTCAAEGRLEGTKHAYDRMDALLAKPVLP